MSQESLSALVDGECSDAELDRILVSLDRDSELAQRWSRWHLQREISEGTRVAKGQACICAGVMAALDEPVRSGRVVDLAAFSRRVASLPWKPAVGFAAAASMGAAAVLFMAPQGATPASAGSSTGSGYDAGAGMRVSNPIGNGGFGLPGSRGAGRLQTVSLTGPNSGTTFADEEYAALLRDYVAARNAADTSGTRYARVDFDASQR